MEQASTFIQETGKTMIGVKPLTRVWSYLIDLAWLFVINTAAVLVLGLIFTGNVDLSGFQVQFDWMFLFFNIVYYTLSEGLFGASMGKFLLGLRVADMYGNPCSIWSACVRGVFRYIDGLFLGAIALLSMKAPLQQRVGDKVAKTVVVRTNEPALKIQRSAWLFWLTQFGYFCFAVIGLFFRYAYLS